MSHFSVFIWDIVLENEKDTSSFTDNKMSMYNSALFLYSDGYLSFTRELLSTIQCPMDLREYPHDIQHCQLSFMSFVYSLKELNFTLKVFCGKFEPCDKVSVIESSAFKMVFANGSVRAMDFGVMVPNAVIKIVLQRELQFYFYQVSIICLYFAVTCSQMLYPNIWLCQSTVCVFSQQVYVPVILIVMCSLLTFWIELDMGDQVACVYSLCPGLVAANNIPKASTEIWNCRFHLECC